MSRTPNDYQGRMRCLWSCRSRMFVIPRAVSPQSAVPSATLPYLTLHRKWIHDSRDAGVAGRMRLIYDPDLPAQSHSLRWCKLQWHTRRYSMYSHDYGHLYPVPDYCVVACRSVLYRSRVNKVVDTGQRGSESPPTIVLGSASKSTRLMNGVR
jgi:hypothetical protein